MKKIVKSFALGFLCILFLGGCASIVSKSEYPVLISSQPEGAEIKIKNNAGENVYVGKTPTTINLKAGAGYFKGETYTVNFQKENHTPHTAQIERGVDGWYLAGNLVFGGLIGYFIVDPLTGAMWKLENLHVDLEPSERVSLHEQLHIITIDDVPDNLRSKMIRIK